MIIYALLSWFKFDYHRYLFDLIASMMPTVLTFPVEVQVFRKERLNSWYSVATYFWAKTFADLPFQFFFPALYIIIVYWMTGQIREWDRFLMFYTNNVLLALVGQSQGIVVSCFFVDDPAAAVFVAPTISVPIMLFAGFFVRMSRVPFYLRPIGYLSYMKVRNREGIEYFITAFFPLPVLV